MGKPTPVLTAEEASCVAEPCWMPEPKHMPICIVILYNATDVYLSRLSVCVSVPAVHCNVSTGLFVSAHIVTELKMFRCNDAKGYRCEFISAIPVPNSLL